MGLKANFFKTFRSGLTIHGDIEMTLNSSEFTILFGPSGCGKTTILRCLAGLDVPDKGYIKVDDDVWFSSNYNVEAYKRNIGYVFQDSALFPHLNVSQNIAYGLFKWPKKKRIARVNELMDIIGISNLALRKTNEISGGQKQKVALARALAIKPKLVLLDEPFTSLDKITSTQLRYSLRNILKQLNTPAILVTHDKEDALSLGDKILLMTNGLIVKRGVPSELLTHDTTNNKFVMSSYAKSYTKAIVVNRNNGLIKLKINNLELYAIDNNITSGDVSICIQDEGVSIIELNINDIYNVSKYNTFNAVIIDIIDLGFMKRLILDIGIIIGTIVSNWLFNDQCFSIGKRLAINIKSSAILIKVCHLD